MQGLGVQGTRWPQRGATTEFVPCTYPQPLHGELNMPSYTVARAAIHDEIKRLERKGEHVVAVEPDGDGAWLIVTTKTAKVETR